MVREIRGAKINPK